MKKNKLVFIHGWVGKYIINKNENITDFYRELIQGLVKIFDVSFLILPGFGNTPEPTKPYFLDDYVNFVKDYVDKMRMDKFYLMGHSFGGQIACKFTYLYPEKVEKLILYNAACIRKNNLKRILFIFFSKLFKRTPLFKSLLIKKLIYKILTGTTTTAYYSEVMKKTMTNVIKEDLTKILSDIKAETLIIWGEKDKITPLKHGKLINNLIKNSKLIIKHDGDHNFHKDYPDFIVDNIRKNI